ncbi:MAG: VOC family protein [Gemmatimonadota bacterium]|jgi:catechol 2,3-dioxygenase
MSANRLPETTSIGCVTLRVRDVARSLGFYRDVLGFETRDAGAGALGLGAPGGETAIVLTPDPSTAPRPRDVRGLYHAALLLPDRRGLGAVLTRLVEARYPLQGFADHAVSEAVYLTDPDGNGLELYADRPRETWRWADGSIFMTTRQLDVHGLIEAGRAARDPWLPAGTRVGHIHLQVGDLADAEGFYVRTLGFDVVSRSFPDALFVSAGGYHHHVGLNTWGRPGTPPADVAGLVEFELRVPDPALRDAIAARLRADAREADPGIAGPRLADPDGNVIVLVS